MKFLALVALALSPAFAAAADTGSLLLQGLVASQNSIVVSPSGSNNTSLNITGGESGKLVATVAETSNNLTGYKINVKSLNGSELRNTASATRKTTYTLSYDNASAVSLSTSYQQVKNVSSLSALTSYTSNVKVDVQSYAGAPAGTYEDTVTFQIVANP